MKYFDGCDDTRADAIDRAKIRLDEFALTSHSEGQARRTRKFYEKIGFKYVSVAHDERTDLWITIYKDVV